MHTIKKHRFGPVEAFELGFGPIGPPLMTAFMYVTDGTVIDTGQRRMGRYVAELLGNRRLNRILLTHHHEDHSGNAGMLARKHGAVVMGHPLMADKMRTGFNVLPYQHYMSGTAGRAEVTPFPDRITDGRLRFRPIHTPGHSRDHTVFLEEENGWLFSGDLYLTDRVWFFRIDERIADQIASLEKVLKYDFDALFCGHRPCPSGGKKRLRRKLEFLREFHGSVGALADSGYPEKAIIRKMRFRSDLKIRWITMGNAGFNHMVRSSVRAHRAEKLF
ncbi:MBL fold metallo-hydrolase [Desulfonema ishimotonii]|uniref:MBL fold metallo-hydrolase n=1 Tax=Desulfonema ishimotonii TaxID=45657 RepID=A0A401FXS3_9BACT|nr:MBL fold metallo-hydrolase [Desulfonema ishimotonii]GBC61734.1 MBL fold metallo-hydrolase [Desulfonema ishimotonii]